MEWYVKATIIILPAIACYRLIRPRIQPVKRIMTWLALFFACYYGVQFGNSMILANGWLPDAWGDLPLQVIATAFLTVFVPVREVKEPTKVGSVSPGESISSAQTNTKKRRRFRKK